MNKDNKTLKCVKLNKRNLNIHDLKLPSSKLASQRQGYSVILMTEFYKFLNHNSMLLKNERDFKLFILPVFYLIHGEQFNSDEK